MFYINCSLTFAPCLFEAHRFASIELHSTLIPQRYHGVVSGESIPEVAIRLSLMTLQPPLRWLPFRRGLWWVVTHTQYFVSSSCGTWDATEWTRSSFPAGTSGHMYNPSMVLSSLSDIKQMSYFAVQGSSLAFVRTRLRIHYSERSKVGLLTFLRQAFFGCASQGSPRRYTFDKAHTEIDKDCSFEQRAINVFRKSTEQRMR